MSNALNNILNSFQKLGYDKKVKIKYADFIGVLNKLYQNQFSLDIAQELWQEAGDQLNDQVEVEALCNIIFQAQEILKTRITQMQQNITSLKIHKKQMDDNMEISHEKKRSELRAIEKKIYQLETQLDELKSDLKQVTDPFKTEIQSTRSTKIPDGLKKLQNNKMQGSGQLRSIQQKLPSMLKDSNMINSQYSNEANAFLEQQTPQSDEFKWILSIIIIISIFQIIFSFNKHNNLSLIVCVLVNSIFLLNYFETFYMKLTFALTIISTLVDIVWCVLYTQSYWNPPINGIHSSKQANYLRCIVFFSYLVIVMKIPLMILLFRNRNVSSESRVFIKLFGKYSIRLYNNSSNPITLHRIPLSTVQDKNRNEEDSQNYN